MSENKKGGVFYIGKNLVVDKSEGETHVAVELDDGTKMSLPIKMYEAMISVEPEDTTSVRDRRVMAVVPEIVNIFLKYEVKFSEVETIFQYASNFLNDKLERASAEIWRSVMVNQYPEDLPHGTLLSERTVKDLDNYLEGQKNEQATPEKNTSNDQQKGDSSS